MDPDDILERNGKHAIWIVYAQVFFGGKGEFCQVVKRLNIARYNVMFGEFITITRYVTVHSLKRFLKSIGLQLSQLVTTHAFIFWVPDLAHVVVPSARVQLDLRDIFTLEDR